MELNLIDYGAFLVFIAVVVAVSLYASRKEESDTDDFLAGRGPAWWLIGCSLIASNISTEHFVGMSGSGFGAKSLRHGQPHRPLGRSGDDRAHRHPLCGVLVIVKKLRKRCLTDRALVPIYIHKE